MRISIVNRNADPETVIDLGEHDYETAFIVQVDGKDLFAVDCEYADHEHFAQDPNGGSPAEPHINLGWWPDDGEQWRLLAHLPLSKVVQ